MVNLSQIRNVFDFCGCFVLGTKSFGGNTDTEREMEIDFLILLRKKAEKDSFSAQNEIASSSAA